MSDRSRYHDCGGRSRVCTRSTARARERDRREPRRHAEALLRARVAGVDAPAVDLDGDAAERRDGVDERAACRCPAARRSGAIVVLDAGRRLGVHDGDEARVRVLRVARRGAAADRAGVPTRSSTRTTSAPQRRATSHMRSPNTPLAPTIAVSPGSSRLTKHASMPAEPVPLIGSVSAFVGAEDGAQARHRLVHAPRGTRGPCARAAGGASAAVASGYGFDGPGPSSRRSVIGIRGAYATATGDRRVAVARQSERRRRRRRTSAQQPAAHRSRRRRPATRPRATSAAARARRA